MSNYVLLTGATGLVGRYLLRDLLLDGHRVAVVARASRRESTAERIESIMQMWESELGRALPRPVCLEGDVSTESLGLDVADQNWIAQHCDRVVHNAAILTFYGPDRSGEPWTTNFHGTQHVLEFCREANLRNLHYVSTAYVCGDRPDLVKEDELDVGQGFRNDYEHSKFLAEKAVREADWFDHITVYRPAVIAGDSVTGYTSTYHGMYLYLRLMSMVVANTPPDANGIRPVSMRSNLNGDELRNIVPVDWVSQVIARLFNEPKALGGTYHLSPIEPVTPRKICNSASSYYKSTPVEFVGEAPHEAGMNDVEKFAYSNIGIYESYETTDPRFDTANLLKFTADIPCPRIDEPMMHRFLEFGEQDRWGKRRQPAAKVPFWVRDHLDDVIQQGAKLNGHNGSDHSAVGVDIQGPGGGQWTLTLHGQRMVSCESGIDPGCIATLRMTSAEFLALREGQQPGQNILKPFLHANGRKTNGELSEPLAQALFPVAQQLAGLWKADRGSAAKVPASET